jgi:hypothetical protein
MAGCEDIERRECGFQDQGAQWPVFCKQADRPTAKRLTKAQNAGPINTWVCGQAIIGGIHRDSDRLFGWCAT